MSFESIRQFVCDLISHSNSGDKAVENKVFQVLCRIFIGKDIEENAMNEMLGVDSEPEMAITGCDRSSVSIEHNSRLQQMDL